MRKVYLAIFVIAVLALSFYFFKKPNVSPEIAKSLSDRASQELLRDTIGLSQEYLDLRWQSELILTTASSYSDYETWDEEMTELTLAWEAFERKSDTLGKDASIFIKDKKTTFHLVPIASAITAQEISNVFDRAPAGKKIKTLASHLGVDAKHAYAILKQAQAQMEADAWNEAGDVFQKLETAAIVIKDGCKVAGFVGGVIISGGTAGLAAASTATKAAVIVSGVDLTLEVTEDAANIALGNKNKVAELVGNVRVVTDPLATILNINSVPDNLASGFDKFNAVMLGLDQFRIAAQEGKVVGVNLPTYQGQVETTEKGKIEAAAMSEDEIDDWLLQFGLKRVNGSFEEVLEQAKKIAQTEIKEQVKAEVTSRIEEASEEMSEIKIEENLVKNEVGNAIASPEEVLKIPDAIKGEAVAYAQDGKVKLRFSSPEGNSFSRAQARRWWLEVDNFSKEMGANYVCHWTFYLDGSKFREMLNNKSCGFTSTFIDKTGSLRAEVRIDFTQGRSTFDESGAYTGYVNDVVDSKTLFREFTVIK